MLCILTLVFQVELDLEDCVAAGALRVTGGLRDPFLEDALYEALIRLLCSLAIDFREVLNVDALDRILSDFIALLTVSDRRKISIRL